MKIKILMLTLLLSQSSCELLKTKEKKFLNCSQIENLHPKNQAVCILKTEIKLLRNKKIKGIVSEFEKKGLRNSGVYRVNLIKGGGKGEALYWTYFVSVNYNDLKKYQSIVGLVDIYASSPARLKKVMRGEDLK